MSRKACNFKVRKSSWGPHGSGRPCERVSVTIAVGGTKVKKWSWKEDKERENEKVEETLLDQRALMEELWWFRVKNRNLKPRLGSCALKGVHDFQLLDRPLGAIEKRGSDEAVLHIVTALLR